jgi:hypothetical protein
MEASQFIHQPSCNTHLATLEESVALCTWTRLPALRNNVEAFSGETLTLTGFVGSLDPTLRLAGLLEFDDSRFVQ